MATPSEKQGTDNESNIKSFAIGCLDIILVTAALLASFVIFMARPDGATEVREAKRFAWVYVGPLWGTVAYFAGMAKFRSHRHKLVIAIATTVLMWGISAGAFDWWTEFKDRMRRESARKALRYYEATSETATNHHDSNP
jgi:hypothetical protein